MPRVQNTPTVEEFTSKAVDVLRIALNSLEF